MKSTTILAHVAHGLVVGAATALLVGGQSTVTLNTQQPSRTEVQRLYDIASEGLTCTPAGQPRLVPFVILERVGFDDVMRAPYDQAVAALTQAPGVYRVLGYCQ